jgi:hypothetical protein
MTAIAPYVYHATPMSSVDLGGRRGGSRKTILGSGGGGGGRRSNGRGGGAGATGGGGGSIGKKLEKGTTQAVAVAAFAAVATANPAVGVMYAAYQVASYTYPIAKQGMSEYSRSHNTDRAVDKMKSETIHQTGRAVTDATVDAVAGAAVRGAMSSVGVGSNKVATTFVQTAVTETISEVIS